MLTYLLALSVVLLAVALRKATHEAPVQKFVTGDKVWYTRHTRESNFMNDVTYAQSVMRATIADVANDIYFVQASGTGLGVEAVPFSSARKQLALREEAEGKP